MEDALWGLAAITFPHHPSKCSLRILKITKNGLEEYFPSSLKLKHFPMANISSSSDLPGQIFVKIISLHVIFASIISFSVA